MRHDVGMGCNAAADNILHLHWLLKLYCLTGSGETMEILTLVGCRYLYPLIEACSTARAAC